MTAPSACGFTGRETTYGGLRYNSFEYYFRNADPACDHHDMTARLDRLADAMVEDPPSPDGHVTIPPVFTYLGQFIDHDITANTDTETDFSKVDVERVTPASRGEVVAQLENMRFGSLRLDSLYGGAPSQGEWAERLRQLIRFPEDPALLWIGTDADVEIDGRSVGVALPRDPARDLLRLGRVLEPNGPLERAELEALPDDLRDLYLDEAGFPLVGRAIIGDARNDENLAVAQLHLAFARFHNRIAITLDGFTGNASDRQRVFEWARRQVVWTYQWLIANVYLPTVCDPEVVSQILTDGPRLYEGFRRDHGLIDPELLPLPLEFSVSAFRFGHTMARNEYDWSSFFGRHVAGTPNLAERASFSDLFRFTGNGDLGPDGRLPSIWPIEWDRFAFAPPSEMPDRAARPIDALLALPLSRLENEDPGDHGVLRILARRNLRRAHRLNIPSAQSCIAGVAERIGVGIDPLSHDELTNGATGVALEAADLTEATPLWFYVLKEAEQRGDGGRHLGPLGSRLVAETLIGLIHADEDSYWHAAGTDADGRWRPEDGAQPEGEPIKDMPSMLRAAGLLE